MKLNRTIYNLLQKNSTLYPEKIAFADAQKSFTWKQAFQTILSISAELDDQIPWGHQKLRNINAIVVKGDGSIFHVFLIYALVLNRLVYIPHNRTLQRNEHHEFNSLPQITVVENRIYINEEEWDISTTDSSQNPSKISFESHEVPAAFYYTSGTTGLPKVIANSDTNLFRGAKYVIDALELKHEDIFSGTLLLDFDYGVNQLFCTLELGATYIAAPFSSTTFQWIKLVERYEATIVPTMPFLVENYFPNNSINRINSVRMCTSSGAPLTKLHAMRIRAVFPKAMVVPMYGLSEGFRATILPPGDYESKPDSVGKPIGDTQIRIVNEDQRDCKTGEIGEIWQSSGCLSWGYHDDPDATAKKFIQDTEYPNRFWLRSGDIGYLDDDGYLYVKGRLEFQIKLFGVRVSIDEIESRYKLIPGVIFAVVIPREKNETESNFSVGIVSDLSVQEIISYSKTFPHEYRTRDIRKIPEIIGNYNGGKPDRKAIEMKYFSD
jgi:acyl-CoA synthetase (AMP-forming)/AMP-acid ligase II